MKHIFLSDKLNQKTFKTNCNIRAVMWRPSNNVTSLSVWWGNVFCWMKDKINCKSKHLFFYVFKNVPIFVFVIFFSWRRTHFASTAKIERNVYIWMALHEIFTQNNRVQSDRLLFGFERPNAMASNKQVIWTIVTRETSMVDLMMWV